MSTNGRTIGGRTGWDGNMVDLAHLTLADAARMIAARELSSLELVEATFARIAAFDVRLDSHATPSRRRKRQTPRSWPGAAGVHCTV